MTTEIDAEPGHTSLELVIFGPGTYTWDIDDSDCWRDWTATIEGDAPDPLRTLCTTGS